MNKLHFLELVLFQAGTKLRAEVSRDYLHYLWWAIEPLANMLIYYLVFAVGLRRGGEGYVVFLLVGIITWLWFSKSISGSAMSIITGRAIFHQIPVTKSFFPLVLVFADTARHIVVVILLLLFLIWNGHTPTLAWVSLFPLFACQFILISGCALMIAAIVPFLPDLRYVINLGLQFLFFVSGIFFDITKDVPAKYHAIVFMNPMAGLIRAYRQVLIGGQWPEWSYLLTVGLVAIVLIMLAFQLIKKLDYVYPKVIV